MSSRSAGPLDSAPAGAAPAAHPATADRVIAGLTVWWLAFPIALCAGVGIFSESSRHALWDGIGRALLWVGVGGAALAPAAGMVVALIARRRRAFWRFALMAAVSVTACVVVWLLPS
jgi:hypothetical protein